MATKSIAVLSDNDRFLKAMGVVIEGGGYKPLPYRFLSAEGARKRIQDEPPDLIALDLHMHMGGNNEGFQLLKMLRSDQTTVQLPILLCTMDTWIFDRKPDLLERLQCRLLERPFDNDQFLSMIEVMLEERAHAMATSDSVPVA